MKLDDFLYQMKPRGIRHGAPVAEEKVEAVDALQVVVQLRIQQSDSRPASQKHPSQPSGATELHIPLHIAGWAE